MRPSFVANYLRITRAARARASSGARCARRAPACASRDRADGAARCHVDRHLALRSTRHPEHDADHRGARAKRGSCIEGPHIAAFEAAFAARLGGVRAVSTSYGRMAFYYILKALDLPPGGEIVMPALTFWVMPEMARLAGLTPVFADVDPVTFNITADAIERAITARTVAVVPTHLWGLPCDMDEIVAIAAAARHRGHRGLRARARARSIAAGRSARSATRRSSASRRSSRSTRTAAGWRSCAIRALAARVADLAAAEPPPEPQARQGAAVARTRAADRHAPDDLHMDAVSAALCRARGCTGASTCTSGRRSGRSIRCRRIIASAISNVQAAIALEGLGEPRRVERGAAAARDAHERSAGRCRWRARARRSARPHARVLSVLRLRPVARQVVDACLRRGVDIETLHVDLCSELRLFGAAAAGGAGRAADRRGRSRFRSTNR